MNFNFLNNKINKTNLAIISKNNINYNEYYNSIQKTSDNINKSQFQPGEKVAIFAEKDESFIIIFMALLQNGVIVVPITKKIPAKQLIQMLSAINCSKLLVYDQSSINTIDSSIIVFQINKLIPDKILEIQNQKLPSISLEQDSTITFTSGSSGKPKAVLHTFGNHYFSALGSNENIVFKPSYRWLLSLPLYHVGGLSILFRAMIGGGAVVIPDENQNLVENIRKYNITHISLVATQLIKLLDDEDSINILKNLNCILVGGSYIPQHLIEESIKYNLPIFTTYGSTEMASQVTTTKPNELSKKLFTSGKQLQHRELKISEGGEILVKGKTLFKGFVEKNVLIEPFDSEGWYHTGDLGNIDNDGYLSVIRRKDNMFISGGENIYPEEIEKYLMNMEEIEEAFVIDISNEKFGKRPIGFLRVSNYESVNRTEIIKHLSEHLPKFKIPDEFYKWPEKQISLKPNRTDFIISYKNQELEEIE